MTANECRDRLKALIHRRVGAGDGAQWLEAQLESARTDGVGGVMAEVGRRLGRRPLIAGFADRTGATTEGLVVDFDGDLATLCHRVRQAERSGCAIVFCDAAAADQTAAG